MIPTKLRRVHGVTQVINDGGNKHPHRVFASSEAERRLSWYLSDTVTNQAGSDVMLSPAKNTSVCP